MKTRGISCSVCVLCDGGATKLKQAAICGSFTCLQDLFTCLFIHAVLHRKQNSLHKPMLGCPLVVVVGHWRMSLYSVCYTYRFYGSCFFSICKISVLLTRCCRLDCLNIFAPYLIKKNLSERWWMCVASKVFKEHVHSEDLCEGIKRVSGGELVSGWQLPCFSGNGSPKRHRKFLCSASRGLATCTAAGSCSASVVV